MSFQSKQEILQTIKTANEIGCEFFKKIPKELQVDEDIVKSLLKINGGLIHCMDYSILCNRNLILDCIKHLSSDCLEVLDHSLKDDIDIMFHFISLNGKNFKYASERLKNNRELVKQVLEYVVHEDMFYNKSFKKDKELAYLAFKRNKDSLKFLDKKFRKDKKLLMSATSITTEYIYGKLKNNSKFIKKLISKDIFLASNKPGLDPGFFGYKIFSNALMKNKKFALDVLQKNSRYLLSFDNKIKNCELIIKGILNKDRVYWLRLTPDQKKKTVFAVEALKNVEDKGKSDAMIINKIAKILSVSLKENHNFNYFIKYNEFYNNEVMKALFSNENFNLEIAKFNIKVDINECRNKEDLKSILNAINLYKKLNYAQRENICRMKLKL